MPEGDTVFHTATALRDALAGKTLTRCDIRVPRYATVDLTGQVVDEVLSRGKHLFLRVGRASIHAHLKMEGSWRIGWSRVAAHRIRIVLETADSRATGIDLGVLEVLDRDTDMAAVEHLGPDLLGPDWEPRTAAANLAADPDRPLAPTLLDQRVMAGVGNVYCNELCFVFGRLPTSPVSSLTDPYVSHNAPGICCGSTGPAGTAPPPVIPGTDGNCGCTAAPVNPAAAAGL